jgi:transmembrane sensor
MENEKIVRYLREESTEAEKLEVLKWIEASEEHMSMFSELKNTMILADIFEKEKNPKLSLTEGSGKAVKFLRYAASIIVIIALGSILLIQNQRINRLTRNDVEYIVPNGQTSNIVLSDGSRVYLNSGTTLKQYGGYAFSKRELYLDGEAYFDVVSNKKKPFVIRTSNFEVIATGTSFNVQAYSNLDVSDVTLVSGKVDLIIEEKNEPIVLSDGETAFITRSTQEYSLSQIKKDQYTSWKDGIITFRDTKLEDLAKMLERTYNVHIVFSDDKIKNMRYTGTMLRYKPIDQILDIIEMTSDVKFEIETKTNEPNIITVKLRKPM